MPSTTLGQSPWTAHSRSILLRPPSAMRWYDGQFRVKCTSRQEHSSTVVDHTPVLTIEKKQKIIQCRHTPLRPAPATCRSNGRCLRGRTGYTHPSHTSPPLSFLLHLAVGLYGEPRRLMHKIWESLARQRCFALETTSWMMAARFVLMHMRHLDGGGMAGIFTACLR